MVMGRYITFQTSTSHKAPDYLKATAKDCQVQDYLKVKEELQILTW
jgi:hypothetical protein